MLVHSLLPSLAVLIKFNFVGVDFGNDRAVYLVSFLNDLPINQGGRFVFAVNDTIDYTKSSICYCRMDVTVNPDGNNHNYDCAKLKPG